MKPKLTLLSLGIAAALYAGAAAAEDELDVVMDVVEDVDSIDAWEMQIGESATDEADGSDGDLSEGHGAVDDIDDGHVDDIDDGNVDDIDDGNVDDIDYGDVDNVEEGASDDVDDGDVDEIDGDIDEIDGDIDEIDGDIDDMDEGGTDDVVDDSEPV
ncbi:MAG: hypothetical protein HC809_02395 [Gammaproteobacteria bacterium]|nr:hypothetical protein [Gammaproteobacteria bacterium]